MTMRRIGGEMSTAQLVMSMATRAGGVTVLQVPPPHRPSSIRRRILMLLDGGYLSPIRSAEPTRGRQAVTYGATPEQHAAYCVRYRLAPDGYTPLAGSTAFATSIATTFAAPQTTHQVWDGPVLPVLVDGVRVFRAPTPPGRFEICAVRAAQIHADPDSYAAQWAALRSQVDTEINQP